MSNSTNSSEEYLLDAESNFAIPVVVRFWIFLCSDLVSMLCCLFTLYHLVFHRTLRQSLNNHVIIVLLSMNLFFELTDISLILHYYRVGKTWQVTPVFAQIWSFIDFGFYTTQLIIFAWATVERHILIFHYRLLRTRRQRLVFHYCPLMILLIYCSIYNILIIFYPFCEYFDYQLTVSGVFIPCVYLNPMFSKFDIIFHQIIPTLIIVISSIGLFARVLWQKTRLHRAIQWRRQRKLTIQVLSISVIYLFLQMPWAFLQFCYIFALPVDTERTAALYGYFFAYYISFIFPFVCCGSLPELQKKLSRLLCFLRQPRVIVPMVIITVEPR